MSNALEAVAELVFRESGIRLQHAQHAALQSALGRVLPEADPAAFMRIADDPVEGMRAVARLIDEVTIKETSFFRDRAQLDAIAWRSLVEHAQAAGSQELRVWCAACATGEEAYTLALLAWESFAPNLPPVRILATDISIAALTAARAGLYRERSLRGVTPDQRRHYFDDDAGRLVVGERLRGIVQFAEHNLVAGPMPPLGESRFDVIVCRNVLIYFDGETADRVVDGLRSCLRPGGSLVLGAADVLCGTPKRLAGRRTGPPRDPQPQPPSRPLRRPLGVVPAGPEPLDPDTVETSFLRAMSELESGEALAAAESLRRVLYLDPTFGLAAFALGRAHELAGDPAAARRAYQQALRTIDMGDDRYDHLLDQVDLIDVATACRARLATL